MSGPALAKAQLIPLDGSSTAANGEGPGVIPFDFNPETLTLKVSTGQARDPARRGRQQTQNVAASQATLSFECIFDSTRPRSSDGPSALGSPVKERDVRKRTKAIADLLHGTASGSQPTPQRVRFLWGEFLFDGVVSQHQETFDYFSADGVPLRSKVALTLTERDFRYTITAEQAEPLRDGATSLDSGSGGNDASPAVVAQRRQDAALAAALAPDLRRPSPADIGQRLGAGVSLGASEALAVFGAAALPAGAVLPQFSVALLATAMGPSLSPSVTRSTPEPGRPSSPWGRDAAPVGSAAEGLSAEVVAQRQVGLDPGPGPDALPGNASGPGSVPASVSPSALRSSPPIRGHAHLRPRLALEQDPRLFPLPSRPDRAPLERRPRWEPVAWRGVRAESGGSPPTRISGGCACGCGCLPCRGGLR